MKLRFLTVARKEQVDAARYYEAHRIGLGAEFVDELERTLGRILEHPKAWSPSSRNTRICQMKRFPFSLIYRLSGEDLLVVALQHHSQDPLRWEDRISE